MSDNRGLGIKTEYNKEGWENAEFPGVCETCMGESPYLRMVKEPFAGSCKMCERPYTVFRWKHKNGSRYKRTEVCQTCGKIKNVCQSCLLDLHYGLPVQLRDAVLATQEHATALPESDANREWFAQQHNKLVAAGQDPWSQGTPNEELLNLARTIKTKRDNTKLSVTLASDRKRAIDPEAADAADVVERSRKRAAVDSSGMECAIVAEGLNEHIIADDIRDAFFSYGDIKMIHLDHETRKALVWFTARAAAEKALKELIPDQPNTTDTASALKRSTLSIKDSPRLKLGFASPDTMGPSLTLALTGALATDEPGHDEEGDGEVFTEIRTEIPLPPGITSLDQLEAMTPDIPVSVLAPAPIQTQTYTQAAAAATTAAQEQGPTQTYTPEQLAAWAQWQAQMMQYQQWYAVRGYPQAPIATPPIAVKGGARLPPKPKGPPPPHAFRRTVQPQPAPPGQG